MALLGLMAHYSMTEPSTVPDRSFHMLNEILLKRLEVRGALVLDHLHPHRHEAFKSDMKGWISRGKILPLEDITKGLENAASALHAMFDGKNIGKSIVHVADWCIPECTCGDPVCTFGDEGISMLVRS